MFARGPLQFPPRYPRSCAKTRTHLPPRLLSPRCHEDEVCRRKEFSESTSNHCAILRQPCRYYLKGTCTRTSCSYWHPPECQIYKSETGCKARDKCMFQQHKVDKQPKKNKERLLFTQKKRKRRQECCFYCEKCITSEL